MCGLGGGKALLGLRMVSLPAMGRYAPLLGAVAVALCAELATNALADTFRFTPILIGEQIFTDNVNSDAEDRDADGVTVLTARAQMLLTTTRINAAAVVDASYYEFWQHNDSDAFTANGVAAGRLDIFKNHFYITGLVERTQFFQTPTEDSAAGFAEIQGVQQTNYEVNPTIQTDILGLVDFTAQGRYAQVFFDDPVVDGLGNTLTDITIKQVTGLLTTGDRATLYEASAGGEYIETDTGFRQRNIVGSLELKLTKGFHAIGRYGYEHTEDPTINTIKGPIWSFGGRYTMGENSVVHVEYGRRYNDVAWLGDINFVVTPKLTITGSYSDSLAPVQLQLIRTFSELLTEQGTLDIGAPSEPEIADVEILDQIVRDRDLDTSVVFVNGLQTYTFASRHIQRFYPSLAASEKVLGFDFILQERLSRRLTYTLNMTYENGYERVLGDPPYKAYEPSIEFRYVYNSSTTFAGSYTYRLFTEDGATDTHENVIRVSVAKVL